MIENIVKTALIEDLGESTDITTKSTIKPDKIVSAVIRARQKGILAGMDCALEVFKQVDPNLTISIQKHDGDELNPGDTISTIEGKAQSILIAERCALNFLTHMSGIASLTARYVDEVKGTDAKILDTRKTIPGIRTLQKQAVKLGGGTNHRFGLHDAILIKDNHIAFAGGVETALKQAIATVSPETKIEIEVDNLTQLQEVIETGIAQIVLLDNMDTKMLTEAVRMTKGFLLTEASGGITLDNVKSIAQTGVDYISIGALTHSAPALDIALDIE